MAKFKFINEDVIYDFMPKGTISVTPPPPPPTGTWIDITAQTNWDTWGG